MATLYITEQGAVVRLSGESVVVEKQKRKLVEVELHRLEAVLLFGGVQVTTQAIAKLLDGYGDRVQESVFELAKLEPATFKACVAKLEKFKLEGGESIRIYPLCEACKKCILLYGAEDALTEPEVIIV